MGTVWIKEFTGGLDARRLPETTPAGVLTRAKDGHITRGGEFEQRAAFVPLFTLPAGTVGLAQDRQSLVVFGQSGTAPVLPTGVRYQRLAANGNGPLEAVPSFDLFDNKIYAVGRYNNGAIRHFFDGQPVADWYDGRARVSFDVVDGLSGAQLDALRIDGIDAIAAPVLWTTSNADTAAAIADAVNALTSVPDYEAYATGTKVVVQAVASGSAANGKILVAEVSGGLVLTPNTPMPLAGGGTTGGSVATASFRLVTSGTGGTITNVTVDGVNIMGAPVTRPSGGSNVGLAAAVAAEINSHTSTPDYTATSAPDGTVTIVTADRTDAVNGLLPVVLTTGNVSLQIPSTAASASFTLSGAPQRTSALPISITGAEQTVSATIRPRVNGVSLTAAPVTGLETLAATAAAVASAINSHTSTPEYTATANGAVVTVTATVAEGASANGRVFSFDIENASTSIGLTTSLAATPSGPFAGGVTRVPIINAFSGGEDDSSFTPGDYVRTVKSKMYSTAGSILHFSGIQQPTQWQTDVVGAGFINMATQNSGSERLTAVAQYQNFLAVFAPDVVQIWFVDPDPALNVQNQVLKNTGTSYPNSVTQFGDADVFYLDGSGLRSLRARDSSNAAATTDIGVPVDDLITAKLASLTLAERSKVVGLINPLDKRFWLIIKDEVFVFTFYQNAKVSAWTTYTLSSTVGGVTTNFEIDAAVVHNGRVYIRSGDTIYAYGGTGGSPVYDETVAELWLPYLDANRPTAQKAWTGLDAALNGLWEVSAAMQPTDITAETVIARMYHTTYNLQRIPMGHSSSHLSLRVRSKGQGPAVLSALAVHFEGEGDET